MPLIPVVSIFKVKLKTLLVVLLLSLFSGSAFSQSRPSLIPYRKGDKWGYCDTTKKMLIPIQYDNAFPFVKGKALVCLGKETLQIDASGKVLQKFPYEWLELKEYEMIVFRSGKTGEKGIVSTEGKVILPARYKSIEVHRKDSIEVRIDKDGQDMVGSINRNGDVLKPFVIAEEEQDFYDAPYFCPDAYCFWGPLSEGIIFAGLKGKYGYATAKEEIIVECKYFQAKAFHNGLGYVWKMTPDPEDEKKAKAYSEAWEKSPEYDGSHRSIGVATLLERGFIDRFGNEYWEK